ncbi:AAA family ATPase [Candidatus Peregrinibacteria bacterium]|jgi:ATP-dependent DNA helicase PIF1|nr:AAA family ATPase [Candidatus Peregrinibacteria bacterium]MBT4631441.1 AAA family ATPase [Candidatus Peregrinibacteria bacterium]MBT5516910.1 AAA family ATPase [Candidatus Peregrinibacteria bacterium]MBT5823830.1 AAA family ATPase [Candidatus Peregrinibacteria bacterium]
MSEIEINEKFEEALKRLNKSRSSIFITGNAGTGKSTLLTHFQQTTKKSVVVLAPTGVSALNVGGQTIHSFFGFPPDITPEKAARERPSKTLMKILENLDVMVIDEVSMVRADLMDCIDVALRSFLNSYQPFAGIQMVFIGDLHQLPPVVVGQEEKERFKTEYASPYFFDAMVFQDAQFDSLELQKIYRQKDNKFVNVLNKIRTNRATPWDFDILNSRLLADPQKFQSSDHSYITLTTTNKAADTINKMRLERLDDRSEVYDAEYSGEFENRNHPTNANLELKKGAQIMMLNNDMAGRWVNGSIGTITKIDFDGGTAEDVLHVKLEGEEDIVMVKPHTWELHKYYWEAEKNEMKQETVGSFRQYPIRLAWAITIHKSQGKTFDKVVIDLGRGAFAHGQVYVALSRCRSLEGLLLQTPIENRHIWSNRRIDHFHRQMQA